MIEPSPKTADQTQNFIFEPHTRANVIDERWIGTVRRELLDEY